MARVQMLCVKYEELVRLLFRQEQNRVSYEKAQNILRLQTLLGGKILGI